MKRPSLSDRILRVLGQSPIPVATPALVALLARGRTHPRQRVWTALCDLKKGGLVAATRQRAADARGRRQRLTFWSLAR